MQGDPTWVDRISIRAWGWNVKAPHSADAGHSGDQRSFPRPLDGHTDSHQLQVLGAQVTSAWQSPGFPLFCLN